MLLLSPFYRQRYGDIERSHNIPDHTTVKVRVKPNALQSDCRAHDLDNYAVSILRPWARSANYTKCIPFTLIIQASRLQYLHSWIHRLLMPCNQDSSKLAGRGGAERP